MSGFLHDAPDINLQGAPVANYGRVANGADVSREDAWSHMQDNAGLRNGLAGGQSYANGQAGAQRGPQAHEERTLANNELNSRNGNQNNAIGMAKSLAYGNGPSEGAYQLQNGLNQGLAQQKAMAGSARGGAALATAGTDASANSATMQQNAYTQGQALRASDMATGRGLYGSLTGQQRGQDQARIDQANAMTQYNAGANDKYALGMGQAAVGMGQAANGADQVNQNYYGMGMSPIMDQDEANQQGQEWGTNRQRTKVANNTQDSGDQSGWVGIV